MKTRLALLLSLVALAGCAKNNASVRASAVCAIPDGCKFQSGGCEAEYIGPITIDLSVTTELLLFVQVDNLMPDNGNVDIFKTNTNDAFVQEAVLEYDGLSGTYDWPVTGSATVKANSSSVVTINLLPPAAAATLATALTGGSEANLVAKLRLKGVFADTTSFETGEYQIRILACNGTGCAPALIPTCTAPAVPVVCPNYGQLPTLVACSS